MEKAAETEQQNSVPLNTIPEGGVVRVDTGELLLGNLPGGVELRLVEHLDIENGTLRLYSGEPTIYNTQLEVILSPESRRVGGIKANLAKSDIIVAVGSVGSKGNFVSIGRPVLIRRADLLEVEILQLPVEEIVTSLSEVTVGSTFFVKGHDRGAAYTAQAVYDEEGLFIVRYEIRHPDPTTLMRLTPYRLCGNGFADGRFLVEEVATGNAHLVDASRVSVVVLEQPITT